jgi:hypothetical protein
VTQWPGHEGSEGTDPGREAPDGEVEGRGSTILGWVGDGPVQNDAAGRTTGQIFVSTIADGDDEIRNASDVVE